MLSRTVVIADLCIPNEHRASIERLARFIEEYEPDQVVHVGVTVAVAPGDEEPALTAKLIRLAGIFERLRDVHGGPLGIHPGHALAVLMTPEKAPWLRRLDVAVLPTFHPIGCGWMTTQGDVASGSAFPGSKAIATARAAGRNVVCGTTGAQAIIAETAGRAGARQTRIGAEAGTLDARARRRGFTVVECNGRTTKLILVAFAAKTLRMSVHHWSDEGA